MLYCLAYRAVYALAMWRGLYVRRAEEIAERVACAVTRTPYVEDASWVEYRLDRHVRYVRHVLDRQALLRLLDM
ncbi:MAG: hypothetical protein AB7F75_12935 [Planctomycetota bacterium]